MTASSKQHGGWWACRASLLCLGILACVGSGTTAPPVSPLSPAKPDRVAFKARLTPGDVFADANAPNAVLSRVIPGEVVTLTITGIPKPGFHTFPLYVHTEPQPASMCELIYDDNPDLTPLWPVLESPAEFEFIPGFKGICLVYDKPFTWTQDILVNPKAKRGATTLRFRLKVQACDDNSCQNSDHDFKIPITIAEPLPAEAALNVPINPERFKPQQPREVAIPEAMVKNAKPDTKGKDEKTKSSSIESGTNDGLVAFLLTAVGFGFISLLTPCVFPMIPITVSFFLKEAERKPTQAQVGTGIATQPSRPERKPHSALLLALVYSGTIVTVLTVSGMLLIPIVAPFSAHWATNTFLGILFVVFALSLFGMFEIELPTWLVDLTSSRQGKEGFVGTMFMAMTFTIISFTCVAPFYGSFIAVAAAASSAADWFRLFLGALLYSVAFASPFFLLALFPSFLRKLPRSGAWMNTLKVVMGFLELAAAFKFFRAAEQYFFGATSFFTYDMVLSMYVVLSVLCGCYLLNLFRLPHDHDKPENLGVLQLLFAIGFIGLGLYLTPPLFSKDPDDLRQRGAVFSWVDAFLLRDTQGPSASGTGSRSNGKGVELSWGANLEKGLEEARKQKRRVFIDFTGINCSNCRLNENDVFTLPEIKDLFGKYVLVHLYTDRLPAYVHDTTSADENRKLELQFGSEQLPYYVIVEPTADSFQKVSIYPEGKINSVAQFAAFLRDNADAK
jgi:thiol:disulfide interchange protein